MRVLLIRTSALGDIVHCLPALRLLRWALPESRIAWVVEQSFVPLLENDPDLDEVIPVRFRAWRHELLRGRTYGEIGRAIGAIRRFRADAVLDLMGTHKSGLLAAVSSCGRRIGLRRRLRREPSSAIWLSERIDTEEGHVVDRALAIAGAVAGSREFRGFGATRIRAAAAGLETDAKGGYIVIHPGAAWVNKCYPPAGWGVVARELATATSLPVLLSLGPGEEELGREVAAASGGAARAADAASLPSLVSLLAGARLVIGGDTGPLHLAHALEVPVVCVQGPTDPQTHGPYRAADQSVWHALPCSFCHRRFAEVKPCLTKLSPAVIVERALRLWREGESDSRCR